MAPLGRLAALAGLLALAGCLQPGAPQGQTGSPSPEPSLAESEYGVPWRVGDYWVQRVYYTDDPNETFEMLDYFVESIEKIDGEATLRVSGNEGQRFFWLRAKDGALVREMEGGITRNHDPPCLAYRTDLRALQSFDHACYRFGTQARNASLAQQDTLTTTVQESQELHVEGVGAFNTTRLQTDAHANPLLTEYYAHNACFPARIVIAEGQRTVHLDLVTFACGGPSP